MPKKYLRKILYYSLVAAIAAGTVLGIYYGFIYSPPHAPHTSGPEPRAQGEESAHVVAGKLQWKVQADTVETDPSTGASVLRNVLGQVFGEKGSLLHFEAPLTYYDPEKGEVRIQGPFKGEVGAHGAALHGRDLSWSNKSRELHVKKARLSVNQTHIQSDSLNITPDEEAIRFDGNVEIVIQIAAPAGR